MLRLALIAVFLNCMALADTKLVVLLIGPPGAGKSTQARRLSRKYHIPAVSMSELLKKDAGWGKAGSHKIFKGQMESGELVDDATADRLMRKRLFLKDAEHGFILDGYPASGPQADRLTVMLKERGLPPPVVIFLDVPDDVLRERMKHRHQADDTPEMIDHRLDEYHKNVQFLLERYPGDRLKRIDGARSEEQVWHDVEAALR